MDPSVKEQLTPSESIANPPKPKISVPAILCWGICLLTQAFAFFFAQSSHYVSLLMLVPALLICPAVLRLRDRREPHRLQALFLVIFYLVSAAVTYGLFTVIDRSAQTDYTDDIKEFSQAIESVQSQPKSESESTVEESSSVPAVSSESVSHVFSSHSVTASGTEVTDVIYASPNGKRYHYKASCCGKNAVEITRDDAARRGLTPCKVCAKRDIPSQIDEAQ